jgi:hypothetical protein
LRIAAARAQNVISKKKAADNFVIEPETKDILAHWEI